MEKLNKKTLALLDASDNFLKFFKEFVGQQAYAECAVGSPEFKALFAAIAAAKEAA